MDKLSDEAREIYELLKVDFNNSVDKRFKDQRDNILGAVCKMLDETTETLDGIITARVDGVREELSGDLAQMRSDLDKVHVHTPTEPQLQTPKAKSSGRATPRSLFAGSAPPPPPLGGQGTEADQRGKSHNLYVPPPVRALTSVGVTRLTTARRRRSPPIRRGLPAPLVLLPLHPNGACGAPSPFGSGTGTAWVADLQRCRRSWRRGYAGIVAAAGCLARAGLRRDVAPA